MEMEILKYILDNQGAVITADLLINLSNTTTVSELICNSDKFVSCLVCGTPRVSVRAAVRLCWRRECGGCGALHLCRAFLLTGNCPFTHKRRGCIFSHDLHSSYNEQILTEFGLESLSRTQLCLLLLQSNTNILPSVCHNYNTRNGCEDSCQRLHICEKFLSQDCSCFRTHDFLAPQPLKVLQDKRIPASLFTSLKSIYANKEAMWLADKSDNRKQAASVGLPPDNDVLYSDSNTRTNQDENRGDGGQRRGGHFRGGRGSRGNNQNSDGMPSNPKHNSDKRQGQRDKTEICMFFIKGHCKYEDRCFKAHVKMPYVWEMNLNGTWRAMADNEKIEQAYCCPENAYSNTIPLVYFDTMTCGENKVRRLSTINSVLEPDFIHTTDWLWYWEDENGNWLQYGADSSVHQLASVTSKHLEEMYVNNDKAVVQFKAGSQTYELSFQDMIQTNLKYGTKRIVRRRPQFVSAAEVPIKRKRITNPTAVPDYWDKSQISPTEHRRISLQTSLAEYKVINDLFCETMRGFDIVKIERIQNKALWEAFQLLKNHMKDKNNGKPVVEKKLFHGTDPSHVETICATNFDWRLCGVNGTAYGQGSYFARDAKYSHSYTGTSHVRFMFVSRVLVGEYTWGRSEYKRPPSKDGSNVNLFDSCVDDVANPSIFVVFEKQQIYPEYVLQYKDRSQQTAYHQPAALTAPTPAVRASALVTNPAPTSSTASTKPSVPNPVNNPFQNSLTPAVRVSAWMANPATTSSTASTKPSVAIPAISPVNNPYQNSLVTNLATTSTTNVSISSPTIPHPLDTSYYSISSLSSSSSYASSSTSSPSTFQSTPSLRYTASTARVQTTPARATTAFSNTASKQEKKCVIS